MKAKILKQKAEIQKAKEEAQIFIQKLNDRIEVVREKIESQITQFENTINKNIQFFNDLPNEDYIIKGHFEGLLERQLDYDLKLLSSLILKEDPEIGVSDNSEKDKLVEVNQIIKKALNLFQEQYEKAMNQMHGNLILFNEVKIEFISDMLFSQDKSNANIPINKSLLNQQESCNITQNAENILSKLLNKNTSSQSQNESLFEQLQSNDKIVSEEGEQLVSNVQIKNEEGEVIRNIDIKVKFNKEIHIPLANQEEMNSKVLCFSALQDNRRAVLCTRSFIFLYDLKRSRVIRRGGLPYQPTCIQPLYSYEYQKEEKANFDAQLFKSYQSQVICLNKSENNQKRTDQSQKRNRLQLLVAVGLGDLYQIYVCIYSLQTMDCVLKLPGHLRMVFKVLQAPLDYDSMISFSSDRKVICWNITKGQAIQSETSMHTQSLMDAIILNDKEMATFSLNGEIYLWDILYDQGGSFIGLRQKYSIYRQCLSLYIGQFVQISDTTFFSVTSSGVIEQKYFLELNDYTSIPLLKIELPNKVIGLNTLRVQHLCYALVMYSDANYCDIFRVSYIPRKNSSKQSSIEFKDRIFFPPQNLYLSNVIETPRVQFASSSDPHQVILYIALESVVLEYSLSVVI